MDIHSQVHLELEHAREARLAGNEGLARVCARRAAGLAARDFLIHQRVPLRSLSAMDALHALAGFPGLDPELVTAAFHLTVRVTDKFTLPVEADLIVDAHLLCEKLLPD
jgi:hypothetical protein